jgi:hypothetical protein
VNLRKFRRKFCRFPLAFWPATRALVGRDREGRIVWRYGCPHASFVEVIVLDGISEHGLPTSSEQ